MTPRERDDRGRDERDDDGGGAVRAAREEAARELAGTLVNILVLVGVSLAVEHRALIRLHARRLWDRRPGRRAPVDELAVREFAARVSAYDHDQGRADGPAEAL